MSTGAIVVAGAAALFLIYEISKKKSPATSPTNSPTHSPSTSPSTSPTPPRKPASPPVTPPASPPPSKKPPGPPPTQPYPAPPVPNSYACKNNPGFYVVLSMQNYNGFYEYGSYLSQQRFSPYDDNAKPITYSNGTEYWWRQGIPDLDTLKSLNCNAN